MNRRLPCFLQALLLVCLLVANGTAQDESPNKDESSKRDVSKLSIEELRDFAEFREHFGVKMRAYTARFRAASKEDKGEVFKTRPSVEEYRPLLSKLIAEGTEEEADKIVTWWWHGERGKKAAPLMSQLLVDHHSEAEMLTKFVPRFGWALSPAKAEPLFRKVLEATNVEAVKAATSFSLLELLSKKVKTAEGKEAELLQAEIESLSKSIKTEYAEFTDLVGTPLGERLEGIEFSKNLAIGNPVPDIFGSDLDGVEFKLSDYKDKVVMVSFWGRWCGPCVRLIPHERSLVKQLKGKPFALIGINSDEKIEVAREAVEKLQVNWRSFWNGEKGTFGPISTKWNVYSWPKTYLIDAKGIIRYKDLKGEKLDEAIEKLMAEAGHEVELEAEKKQMKKEMKKEAETESEKGEGV